MGFQKYPVHAANPYLRLESGETMKAAGLKAIGTVMDTQAVLIKSKNPNNPKLVDIIVSRIRGVISTKSLPCFVTPH